MGNAQPRSSQEIWADWLSANESGDVERAGVCAEEMTRVLPDSYFAWFEAGLHSKAVQDWAVCAARNERAAALFTSEVAAEFGGANPAAWNLGIAATALADWATARRAWAMYGIGGMAEDTGPIRGDYGQAPIRLNPDRPSLSVQRLPQFGGTEIVWCWRQSPAHAVIQNVPLPESGHRFHDVVLHDGEPKGTRMLGDREVSVFDELAKLSDSGVPTWQAIVTGATSQDISALADLAFDRDLGVDDWSGIQVMCADCSHGNADTRHGHQPTTSGQSMLGLAGSEPELNFCLNEWLPSRPLIHIDLEVLWP